MFSMGQERVSVCLSVLQERELPNERGLTRLNVADQQPEKKPLSLPTEQRWLVLFKHPDLLKEWQTYACNRQLQLKQGQNRPNIHKAVGQMCIRSILGLLQLNVHHAKRQNPPASVGIVKARGPNLSRCKCSGDSHAEQGDGFALQTEAAIAGGTSADRSIPGCCGRSSHFLISSYRTNPMRPSLGRKNKLRAQ